MFSTTLMIPINDATQTLRRLQRMDGPSPQADGDIAHVADVCRQLQDAKSLVMNGNIHVEIDPDFIVDDALENLKNLARALRREMGMVAAIASATAEIYKAANQLQWELSEHDVDYAPRTFGYVAHNAQELDELFDRILREK